MGKSSGGGWISTERARKDLDEAVKDGRFALSTLAVEPVAIEDQEGVRIEMQSRTYPDFTPAVNRGAQALDVLDPTWFEHIDVSALDLDNKNACVLGQTWTHYSRGLELAEQAERRVAQRANNFDRFATVVTYGTDETAEQWTQRHGFSFTHEVYAWNHLEVKRRTALGEREQGERTFVVNGKEKTANSLSWQVDAELWEHLTKTWLVMIEARQKAKAKADAEEAARIEAANDAMTALFKEHGITDTRGLPNLLVAKGLLLTEVYEALQPVELPDDQGWDFQGWSVLTPTAEVTPEADEDDVEDGEPF